MDLFKKIGELKCCQEKETDSEKRQMTHCLNGNMIGRKEMEIQERKKQNNKHGNYNNNRGGYNNNRGNHRGGHNNRQTTGFERPEDTE